MGSFVWRVSSFLIASLVLLLAWSWPSMPVRSIPSGDRLFSERNLRGEGYDYIVVGAGPAGCAFVARLAQQLEGARPSILLLEAGPDGRKDVQSRNAGQWINLNYRRNSILDWGYQTYLAGHGKWSNYQRGKSLGGSAAINVQMWVLGDPKDWDDFAKVIPSQHWPWSSMQPLYAWLNGLYFL
jgi:choline dehydrogenase-like flavoprotein